MLNSLAKQYWELDPLTTAFSYFTNCFIIILVSLERESVHGDFAK